MVDRFFKGEKLTASKLNELRDEVMSNRLMDQNGVSRTSRGTNIDIDRDKTRPRPDHFDISIASGVDVRVYAGSCISYVHGTRYETEMDVDGGGTSESSDDYKTVTLTEDSYIYLELSDDASPIDDSLNPDKLEVLSSTTRPSETDGTVRVLGYVTFGANIISKVEQYKNGDWYRFFDKPDELSTNFAASDLNSTQYHRQIYNWHDPSGDTYVAVDQTDDLFMFREYDDASLKYITLESMMQSMSDWSGVDLTGASWTDPPWDEPGESYKSHHALDAWDAVDESVGEGWNDFDDHGVGSEGGAFAAEVEDGYPLMLIGDNGTDAACYDRNKISGEFNFLGGSTKFETAIYVDSIYDESGTAEIIDVDGGALNDISGNATVSWWQYYLIDSSQGTSIDWDDRLLLDSLGNTTLDYQSAILYDADGTTIAVDWEGHVLAGFWSVNPTGTHQAYLGNDTSNYCGYFIGASEYVYLCDGTYGVNVGTGAINSEGGYYDDGVPGADQTSPALVIGDASGGSHTYYLRGGILCAS